MADTLEKKEQRQGNTTKQCTKMKREVLSDLVEEDSMSISDIKTVSKLQDETSLDTLSG
jgi:hypothetical protein